MQGIPALHPLQIPVSFRRARVRANLETTIATGRRDVKRRCRNDVPAVIHLPVAVPGNHWTRTGRTPTIHTAMKPLNIAIVTPAPARSRHGNRVTAVRWAQILRRLGHKPRITPGPPDRACDALIALHARRSHAAIRDFVRDHPDKPLIVALTGTDIYGGLHTDPRARRSLEMASRLVVLQSKALDALSPTMRQKTRVIYQSADPPSDVAGPRQDKFEICVVGHLRPVKDPFRAAMASRLLPDDSRIRIVHMGMAMSAEMARRAEREAAGNPRYTWLGDVPRWKARRRLARSRCLVLSSKSEGGPSVITESVVASVPVISSLIDGSIGIFGDDYPGYFPVGDTQALATMLSRFENDANFRRQLARRGAKVAPLFDPAREMRAWAALIDEST